MGQGILFLQTVALGAIIAFIFDITRAIRKVVIHKNFVVQIEDAIFWLVSFLVSLYFVLNYAGGQIRFFYMLGIMLGIVIYLHTVSRYILGLLTFLLALFIKICLLFARPAIILVKKVLKKGLKILLTCVKIIKTKIKEAQE